MRSAVLLLATLAALVAPSVQALSVGAPDTLLAGDELVVGYEPGQKDAVSALLRDLGATVLPGSDALGFVLARSALPGDLLGALASAPGVTYAETDDAVQRAGAQWNGAEWNGAQWNGAEWNGVDWNGVPANGTDDPGRAGQWGLERVHAAAAWAQHAGDRKARLCILDSGVAASHPDLAGNVAPGYDATGGSVTTDVAGHGTHMAGIAAGVVGNGYGVSGMGNVLVVPVRVLEADGHGKESHLARGLAWCADHGGDVALMALSADKDGPTMDRALAYADQHGVVLVASAGNRGPCDSCVAYPARDPRVLAVGAIDAAGATPAFSSKGPEVDLVAPGADVLSTFPDNRFVYGSGTSQAAAHVAGIAALVRDAHPDLAPAATRALLVSTAGKGDVVDAGAALRQAGS